MHQPDSQPLGGRSPKVLQLVEDIGLVGVELGSQPLRLGAELEQLLSERAVLGGQLSELFFEGHERTLP